MDERKASNPHHVKRHNRALVMRQTLHAGGMSRSELSASTGLTKGGLSPIVGELVSMGLLVESQPESRTRGRAPIALSVNPESCRLIAADWTRRDVSVALATPSGSLLDLVQFPLTFSDSPEQILRKIGETIHQLTESQIEVPVIGVGVVAPGPLDADRGVILSPPNFHGWTNIRVSDQLENLVDLPVFLDNNANAHGIAAKDVGSGREYSNFVTLVVDDGIGSAIVIDNRIYRGSNGHSSEFGHVTIDAGGPTCACGNAGCLELYASVPNLLRQLNQSLSLGTTELITGSGPDGSVIWSDVIAGLERENYACVRLLEQAARYIGAALVSYINLLGPEAVILSGQLAEAGLHLVAPLAAHLENRVLVGERNIPEIIISDVRDPSLIGGAAMVFERFINGELGEYEKVLASGKRSK